MQHYIWFSTSLLIAALGLSACGGSDNNILPVRQVETGTPVTTVQSDRGVTSANFPELGGDSRAIRGAVANHYWVGVELIPTALYRDSPKLTRLEEGRLIATDGQRGYTQLSADVAVGTRYMVYRVNQEYVDRLARKSLGVEAEKIAEAVVIENITSTTPSRTTLEFTAATQEIRPGDILLSERRNYAQVVAKRPQINLSGRIIATVGNSTRIGPQQVVTVNLGSFDDVKPGHLLGIYDTQDAPSAATMLGELVIVRVYGTLSYGVVTRVRQEVPMGAQVANPATTL